MKKFVDLIKLSPPLLIGGESKVFADFLHKELGVTVKGYYTDIHCPQDIAAAIAYIESVS